MSTIKKMVISLRLITAVVNVNGVENNNELINEMDTCAQLIVENIGNKNCPELDKKATEIENKLKKLSKKEQ